MTREEFLEYTPDNFKYRISQRIDDGSIDFIIHPTFIVDDYNKFIGYGFNSEFKGEPKTVTTIAIVNKYDFFSDIISKTRYNRLFVMEINYYRSTIRCALLEKHISEVRDLKIDNIFKNN